MITNNFEIGMAVVVRFHGSAIYGRIETWAGNEWQGIWPRMVVRTPGGSTIESGRHHVRPAIGEEMDRLIEFEREQMSPEYEKIVAPGWAL